MFMPAVIFAYFGPETVLPVTSVIATVVGIVMMFGKNTLRLIFRWRKSDPAAGGGPSTAPKPHFWQRKQARNRRS
jgi:hypothetical protein